MNLSILRIFFLCAYLLVHTHALAIRVSRAGTIDTKVSWIECLDRGKRLWTSLKLPGAVDKLLDESGLANHYHVDSSPGVDWYDDVNVDATVITFNGAHLGVIIQHTDLHMVKINGNGYKNLFDTGHGIIAAVSNRHSLGRNPGAEASWSDLMLWQYAKLATKHHHKLSALTYILRMGISNIETKSVIDEAYKKARKTADGTWDVWKYADQQETFLALLGTVNGFGVAYMLIDYPVTFKGKTIISISTRIYQTYNMPWYGMLLELGSQF